MNWILRGTDLPPDTRIGKILPQGRIATVKTVAVALAMAGGRPEYLPVLIAAVEALIDPGLAHQSWQATSSSVYPAVIVNGPVARQIRLNSGFGLLGPDALHPAGGVIGRALRLLLQNVGGAVPGVGTMSQFGGMRYTNAVFAEDEEGLPPGWEPLSVEYFGAPRGTNCLALYTVSSATNITRRGTGKETPEEEALGSLYRIAAYMEAPNVNGLVGYDKGAPGILLLSSIAARQLANLGWTKEKIKEFLWENSKIPVSKLRRAGMLYYFEDRGIDLADPAGSLADHPPGREPHDCCGGGEASDPGLLDAGRPGPEDRERPDQAAGRLGEAPAGGRCGTGPAPGLMINIFS